MPNFSDILSARYAATSAGSNAVKWRTVLSAAAAMNLEYTSAVARTATAALESQLLSLLDSLATKAAGGDYGESNMEDDVDSLRSNIFSAMPATQRSYYDPTLCGAKRVFGSDGASGFVSSQLSGDPYTHGPFAKFRTAARSLFNIDESV
jgi:hypothetical protein